MDLLIHNGRSERMLRTILLIIALTHPMVISATYYYVDSSKGNDDNRGNNISDPWKSLVKVNSQNFKPGDIICFLRGSEWTGELTIKSSGTEPRPIIYTAYGHGPNPVIKNPGVDHAVAIKINADWIVVENFMISDSHEAGISISSGAEHNIIRNNEVTKSGIGISINGAHNLAINNFAHDLTIVVSDEGGDNDYGAIGIGLFGSNNEVSYNRMINCSAPSLDYGFDGGMVEFYGDVDSCYVHHNWGENCNGTFEVGGQGVTLTHNIIAYNICINNGGAGGFHVGGKFGVKVEDMRVENNIFADSSHGDYAIGFWNGTPDPAGFIYRNNIFHIPEFQRVSNHPGFIHEHNLYYLGGKTEIGITPGCGDIIGNPLFKDINKKDYHLNEQSPAIDAGINLNYTMDFEGNTVPNGSAPDIGAFEYIKDL
jgi:hypothetical protein